MKFLKKIWSSIINLLKQLFLPQRFNQDVYKEESFSSPGKLIFKNFIKNKLAITGIIGFILIFTFSFVLSLFVPLELNYTNTYHRDLPPNYQYLSVPKQLEKEGIASISSGNYFSIGLSNKGEVFVWGANSRDILNVPDEIRDKKIVEVSAGSQHALVRDEDNNIYFWGYNHQQQAQFHERIDSNTFVNDPIDVIKAGIDKTGVITESGKLYIWGVGANNPGDAIRRTPYEFTSLDDQNNILKAIDFEMNVGNVIVLLEDGTVRVLGTQNDIYIDLPVELTDGSVIISKIEISVYNGFAIDTNGKLYVWGSDGFLLNIERVPLEFQNNIIDIATGYQHAVVLREDGQLYAWGDNHYGQLEFDKSIPSVSQLYVNTYQNYLIDDEGNLYTWGLKGFIFGTDEQGRDFLAQMIHGGKITLTVGAVAVVISLVIGVTVGMISGYYGGRVDNLLMRFAEIVSSFPFLPFAITLSSLLVGTATTELQRMLMIMVILGVLSWTGLARLVRGQILSEREKDYITAAKALGIKQKNIIWRHIFPAIITIVIVNATLGYAGSLLTEAGLSFLGFGVQKPNPSWGNILTAAQEVQVIRVYWWRWILPGFAIIMAALSINLIGDALRDAMDPKNTER
jgi:peptide/nickel transport system permease protein